MRLSDQCCTLQQAIRLKELGVTGPSIAHWGLEYDGEDHHPVLRIGQAKEHKRFQFQAYTVAELGVMLPDYLTIDSYRMHVRSYKQEQNNSKALWTVTMGKSTDKDIPDFDSNSEAEARAALLIYLLENNLVTPSEVNNRLNK